MLEIAVVSVVVLSGIGVMLMWSCSDQDDNAYERAVDLTEYTEPRCDITGEPLTPQQCYERECG